MLSFDTVHAITDHLYLADVVHRTDRLTAAPTLLLLQQASRPSTRRRVRALAIPLLDVDADAALPEHLSRLTDTAATAGASTVATPLGRSPLLAVAVLYTDVVVYGAAVAQVHQVDAVDIDGRCYRLTRYPGDNAPTLLVDDLPERCSRPATHAALTAALAAVRARYTQPTSTSH